MKHKITKGERVMVGWLINNIQGVNRTDARLIQKVDEHLVLDELAAGVPLDQLKDVAEFELTDLEVTWILDHINKSFEKQGMITTLSKHALTLEDKLNKP